MPTHDYIIDNQSASTFRADLNNVLQAIVSQNANPTAPTVTFADMFWYDSTAKQLKKRNEANTGWIALGDIDEISGKFTPSGSPGLSLGANSLITINTGSGVVASTDNDGTPVSPYTPTPIGGNFKSVTNNGAFTIAAPTAAGDYTMFVQISNGSTPGAITSSGFNRVTGDLFTTTVNHRFFVNITKCNGFTALVNQALQ
jgi:hypothetical protein